MANIDIDTSSIFSFSAKLKSKAASFEAKASSFSSGLALPGVLNTKISTISNIIKNIALNLNSVSTYASNYVEAVRNIENSTEEPNRYILPVLSLPIPNFFLGVNDGESDNKVKDFKSPYTFYRESLGLSNTALYKFLIDERDWNEKYNELIDNLSDDAPIIKEYKDIYGLNANDVKDIIKGNTNLTNYKNKMDIYNSKIGKEMIKAGFKPSDIRRVMSGEITYDRLIEEIQNDKNTSRLERLINIQLMNEYPELYSEFRKDNSSKDALNLLSAYVYYQKEGYGEIYDSLVENVSSDQALSFINYYYVEYSNLNCSKEETLDLIGKIARERTLSYQLADLYAKSEDNALLTYQNNIVDKIKNGSSYEDAVSSEIVGYRDYKGVIHTSYADAQKVNNEITAYNGSQPIITTPEMVSYLEMYGDEDTFLSSLKGCLTESTTKGFLGFGKKDILIYTGTAEQKALFDGVAMTYRVLKTDENNRLNSIINIESELNDLSAVINSTNVKIVKDFEDSQMLEKLGTNNSGYTAEALSSFNKLVDISTGNSKKKQIGVFRNDQLADVVSYIINNDDVKYDAGKIITPNGNIKVICDDAYYTDDTVTTVLGYLSTMDEKEKMIFNAIYNTQGKDAAIKYLYNPEVFNDKLSSYNPNVFDPQSSDYIPNIEGIIFTRLDDRWHLNKLAEDNAWATTDINTDWKSLYTNADMQTQGVVEAAAWIVKNSRRIGASAYSVVATPFEGLSAAWNSYEALSNNIPILKKDVYSKGDIFRQAVSADITNSTNSVVGFLYDTGMSMVDSLYMMGTTAALTTLTGGVAAPIIGIANSAVTMGARVYVSSLNEGLDRGLSDEKAVITAVTSGAVETIMEYFSMAHLGSLFAGKGLDGVGSLGKNLINATGASGKFSTFTLNLLGNQISQAFFEGDEELWTELLNFVNDRQINKEKSNYDQQVYSTIVENLMDAHKTDASYTLENAKKEANILYLDKSSSAYKEASTIAYMNLAKQAGIAWLGGALSGFLFGSAAGVRSSNTASRFAEYQTVNNASNTLNYNEAFVKGLEFNEALANNGISLKNLLESGFSLNTQFNIDGKQISLGEFLDRKIEESGNRGKFKEFISKFIPIIDEKYTESEIEISDLLNEFKNIVKNNDNSKNYDAKINSLENGVINLKETFKGIIKEAAIKIQEFKELQDIINKNENLTEEQQQRYNILLEELKNMFGEEIVSDEAISKEQLIIKVKRDEIYKNIIQMCGDNYSFGMHGIANYNNDTGKKNDVPQIIKNIFKDGLKIYNGRTLFGTIAYNNYEYRSEERHVNYYKYGTSNTYIIVAMPKEITNNNGEKILLGMPSITNKYLPVTTNYSLTSLADALLPDYSNDTGIVDSSFILGAYTLGENDNVTIEYNPNHISFQNGLVSDELFNSIRERLDTLCKIYNIPNVFMGNANQAEMQEVYDKLDKVIKQIGNSYDLPQDIQDRASGITDSLIYDFPILANETLNQVLHPESYEYNSELTDDVENLFDGEEEFNNQNIEDASNAETIQDLIAKKDALAKQLQEMAEEGIIMDEYNKLTNEIQELNDKISKIESQTIEQLDEQISRTSDVVEEQSNVVETLVTDTEKKVDLFSKNSFDESKTYNGFDKVVKLVEQTVDNFTKTLQDIIRNNNTGENVLLEIPNTTVINWSLIEQLPDNVRIRIDGAYIQGYLENGFKNNIEKIVMREKVTYTKDELLKIQKELEKIESGIDSNWTNYQKALYIYEYLKTNMTYSVPSEINKDKTGNAYRGRNWDSLIGLTEHLSTCSGFAFIYQELLARQGINSYVLSGKCKSNPNLRGSGSHAWNVVEIDGKTLFVDAIWDTQLFSKGENVTEGFAFDITNCGRIYSYNGNLIDYLLKNGYITEDLYVMDNESLQHNLDVIKDNLIVEDLSPTELRIRDIERIMANPDYATNEALESELADLKLQKILPKEISIESEFNETVPSLMNVSELLEILKNDDTYSKFKDFNNNKEYFSFNKHIMGIGIKQLIEAANKNGYDLELTDEQLERANIIIENLERERYINIYNNIESNPLSIFSKEFESLYEYCNDHKEELKYSDLEPRYVNETYRRAVRYIFENNLDVGNTENFNKLLITLFDIKDDFFRPISNKEILDYVEKWRAKYSLDDSNYHYMYNNFIKFVAKEFIENELIQKFQNDYGDYFTEEQIIDILKESIVLLDEKRYKELYGDYHEMGFAGFNNGDKIIIELRENLTVKEILHIIMHESTHQVSFNSDYIKLAKYKESVNELGINGDFSIEEASGIRYLILQYGRNRSNRYVAYFNGINEAITELLTSQMAQNSINTIYKDVVIELEKFIKLGILNIDIIKEAYFTNNIGLITDYLKDSLNINAQQVKEIYDAFDDAISDEKNTREKGLEKLKQISESYMGGVVEIVDDLTYSMADRINMAKEFLKAGHKNVIIEIYDISEVTNDILQMIDNEDEIWFKLKNGDIVDKFEIKQNNPIIIKGDMYDEDGHSTAWKLASEINQIAKDSNKDIIVEIPNYEILKDIWLPSIQNPERVTFKIQNGKTISVKEAILYNAQKEFIDASKEELQRYKSRSTSSVKISNVVKDFFDRNGNISKELDTDFWNPEDYNSFLYEYRKSENVGKMNVYIGDIIGSDAFNGISNIYEWLSECFSDDKNNSYSSRSNGILRYNMNDMASKLLESIETDEIGAMQMDGKYFIVQNGNHRASALKASLLIELSKAKTYEEIENIRKKYTIPINVQKVNEIVSYCSYLLEVLAKDTSIYNIENGRTVILKGTKKISLTESDLIKYVKNTIGIENLRTWVTKASFIDHNFAKFVLEYFPEIFTTELVENYEYDDIMIEEYLFNAPIVKHQEYTKQHISEYKNLNTEYSLKSITNLLDEYPDELTNIRIIIKYLNDKINKEKEYIEDLKSKNKEELIYNINNEKEYLQNLENKLEKIYSLVKNDSFAKYLLSLSDEEYGLLGIYSGSGYINAELRRGKMFDKFHIDYIEALDRAVANFELEENTILYRAINFQYYSNIFESMGIKTKSDLKNIIGKKIVDKGFSSTSANYGGAGPALFLGDNIFIEIYAPKGMNAFEYYKLNLIEYEKEIILPRNTTYEFFDYEEKDGKIILKAYVY